MIRKVRQKNSGAEKLNSMSSSSAHFSVPAFFCRISASYFLSSAFFSGEEVTRMLFVKYFFATRTTSGKVTARIWASNFLS